MVDVPVAPAEAGAATEFAASLLQEPLAAPACAGATINWRGKHR